MKRTYALFIAAALALASAAPAAHAVLRLSPEAEATFATPAVDRALGVYLTTRGQSFFYNRLQELIYRQGYALDEGDFEGWNYHAQEPIQLGNLPVRYQQFHGTLNDVRGILKKWLKGFTFNDPQIDAEIANIHYNATFNVLGLRPDKELTNRYIAGPNGVTLVFEVEAPEIRIEVASVRAHDLQNPFLGVFGVNNLWTAIKDPAQPLRIQVPVAIELDPWNEVNVSVAQLTTNLRSIPFDMGFDRPMLLPPVEVIVNGRRMRLKQDKVEEELLKQKDRLLTALQAYLNDLAEERIPATINQLIGDRLINPFTEVNEMNPPGAPDPTKLRAGDKYRWGVKPATIRLSDDYLEFGLTGFFQDPKSRVRDTVAPGQGRSRAPLLNLYRPNTYDVALSINQNLVNRVLQLSFRRGYFDSIPLSGGNSLHMTKAPEFRIHSITPQSGTATAGHAAANAESRLHVRISQNVEGIQNLVVRSPLEFEADIVLKLEAHQDGSVSVAIDHIDERSLRIEDRYIKIPLLAYKVWKAVIDKIRSANATFRTAPAVIVPKLPIPSQVAGIPLKLKDFQSDGAGYMVLYLEYAGNSRR